MKKWILLLIIFGSITTSAQNIGIGTTTPTSKFQIHSTATFGRPTIRLVDSTAGSGPILEFRNGGGDNYFQMGAALNNADPTQSFFSIYSNLGGTPFTIKGNNTIGLGTFDPQQRLHVHNDGLDPSSQNAFAAFTNTVTGPTSTDGVLVGVNSLGNGYMVNQEPTGSLGFATAGVTRLSISETGNVGINFFGAQAPLHVRSVSSSEIARFQATDPFISFFNGTTYKGYLWHQINRLILGTSTPEPVVISANYNEMAYFTPSGNLGLNTPTPTERLDVNGNINLTGLLKVNGNAGTTGQVLTSNGGADPQWSNAAYSNTTRFSVSFNQSAEFADVSFTSVYNLSPSDVTIGSNNITINKTGLYHFEGVAAASSRFTTVQAEIPALYFSLRSATTTYDMMYLKQMPPTVGSQETYSTSEKFSIDLYIVAPKVIVLSYTISNATPGAIHNLRGWFNGNLISE